MADWVALGAVAAAGTCALTGFGCVVAGGLGWTSVGFGVNAIWDDCVQDLGPSCAVAAGGFVASFAVGRGASAWSSATRSQFAFRAVIGGSTTAVFKVLDVGYGTIYIEDPALPAPIVGLSRLYRGLDS